MMPRLVDPGNHRHRLCRLGRIEPGLGHPDQPEPVRLGFVVPGVVHVGHKLQHAAGGGGAQGVIEERADGETLLHLPDPVPLRHVADLVRQNERERVIARHELCQTPEEVDKAARQGERVDGVGIDFVELERIRRRLADGDQTIADPPHPHRQQRVGVD